MPEKRENNEEFVNSQSSQLEEEHLEKLEADSVPKNTKTQTSWGLKKFTQWLEKRKINCDLLTVSRAELNGILRRFYAEAGADEQELATPILSLCHGIFTDCSIFSTPFFCERKAVPVQ